MNIETAVINGLCTISFSLASRGFFLQGNATMATLTGILASITAILCLREVLKSG